MQVISMQVKWGKVRFNFGEKGKWRGKTGKGNGGLMDVGGTYLKGARAFDSIFLSHPRPKRLARKREKYASTLASSPIFGVLGVLTAGGLTLCAGGGIMLTVKSSHPSKTHTRPFQHGSETSATLQTDIPPACLYGGAH